MNCKNGSKKKVFKYILLFLIAISLVIHGTLPLLSGGNTKIFSIIIGIVFGIIFFILKKDEKNQKRINF
jgi:membrane associated rhomboid family serine protease